MSDTQPHPDWRLASDGKWYPPQPQPPMAPPPGWWLAPDGQWHPQIRARVHVADSARWAMRAMCLLGCAAVAWGWVALGATETPSSNPVGSGGAGCKGYPGMNIGPLMAPWLVLVLLACIAAAVWFSVAAQARRRNEKMDPTMTIFVIPGMIAAVVLFPGWWVLLIGMNCSF